MIDRKRWFYIFLVGMAMFISTYTQYQLSPISGDIIERYALSVQEFGSLFTAPMIPPIFLSIVAGLLIDKLGPRPVLFSALSLTVLGIVARVFVSSGNMLFLAMVFSGFASGVVNSSSAKVAGQWFPKEDTSSAVGVLLSFGAAGTIVGMATTAYFPSVDAAFIAAAVFSVLVSLAIVFFLKFPEKHAQAEDEQGSSSMGQALKTVLRSPNIWLAGICAGFVMGLTVALSSYLPMALQEKGMSLDAAGLLTSVYLVGVFVGTAIGPTVMSKSVGFKPYMVGIALITALATIFGWQADALVLAGSLLFIAGFGIGSFKPILLSLPMHFPEVGRAYAATGGGVISTCQLLGAVFLPTHLYLPLSGGNFVFLFILAAIGFGLIGPLSILLRLDQKV